MADHLKVLGVPAETLVALVIDLLLGWDVSKEVGIGHDVHGNGDTVEAHPTIATSSTITRGGAGPEVTWGWDAVDDVSRVDDLTATKDLVNDRVASFKFQSLDH
jgi:hypothetical protein